MDEEEQRRIDEEARAAGQRAEDEAIAALARETAPHRQTLDLGEQPDLDRVTLSAAPTMSTTQASDATYEPIDTDALTDPETGTASPIHAFDSENASPLGDRQSGGGALAPSGHPESATDRWARLGVGGDFRTGLPAAPSSADDDAEGLAIASLAGESPPVSSKPEVDAEQERAAGPLRRLDEGLPTEEEIARERGGEGVGHLTHNLGNALRSWASIMAGGGPGTSTPFVSHADELEQRRATGLERRQAAKGAQRTAETSAARQASLDERAQRQLDQGERRLDIAAQQAQTQSDATRALIGQREAQTEHLTTADEIARGAREAREAVDSATSEGARRAWLVGVARLPQRMQDQLNAKISPDELPAMSAAQLEAPLRMLERVSVGVRGSGMGGGGGAAPDALAQQLVDRGITQSREEAQQLIDAIGTRGARATVQADLTPAARARGQLDEGGLEILPGVRAPLADTTTRRQLQTAFAQARTQYASLGEVEQIAERFGRSGPISPEAAGQLGGPLSRLRAMVASLQNTGVINPSEAPTIEAMLPDPRSVSQMTFDTLRGRLRSFRTELDSQVTSALATRGVDEAGVREALRQLHGAIGSSGGGSSQTPAASSGTAPADAATVRMRLPTGEVRRFPASSVQQAEALGAVRL